MENNIKFLNDTIKFVCNKLNDNNINFYIVGAIGGYIDAGLMLQRKHDDLDLMIEEKDIEKVKTVFDNTDFVFVDDRFSNNKFLNDYGYPEGDHEVYANHKYINFHIGFFLVDFKSEEYTIIEYFKDSNVCKKLERSLPIEIFKYQYNENCNYLGIKVKVARKELIYKNKKVMNREKDLFDIKNLEPFINEEIVSKLKGLSKLRKKNIIEV